MIMYKNMVMIFILISFCKVKAQSSIVFGLEKEYTTRHIRMNKANPYVYSIKKKDIVIEKKTRIKKKSLEYETLKQEISDFENHMDIAYEDYDKSIEKYNSLNIAIHNINQFVNSHNPIEVSRNILIESQEIINQFEIDKLVYADNQVNTEQKTKFIILSSNLTSLRLYLKDVVTHIESINIEPKSPPSDIELAELKEQLKEMKPYKIEAGPKKRIKKSKLVLNSKIRDIPRELNGNFIIVDEYTIVLKDYDEEFKKGYLVKMDVAEEEGLLAKGYVKKTSKKIVENTSSKKRYIIDSDFLKKYAFTFNGKYRYQAKKLMSSL